MISYNDPICLLQRIYGTESPREDWKGNLTRFKILHAGSFQLDSARLVLENFFKKLNISFPLSIIEKIEVEDIVKNYIGLELTNMQWEIHIKPMRDVCKKYRTKENLTEYLQSLEKQQSLEQTSEKIVRIYQVAKEVVLDKKK